MVSAEFEVEGILDFGVETDECRESPGLVALADVVPIDADVGVREAGVNVDDGHELKTLRELDDAPEKDSVGSVVGEGAVLIGADERTGEVSEKLVVVVEFAPGSRAHVAGDHGGVFEGLPAEHKEEFTVILTAGIVETELGGSLRGLGRVDEKFAEAVAELRTEPEEQVLA